VWGLGVDDIGVGSFHGTSTNANDKNESEVVNTQMAHLGRAVGNPVFVIAQKWLTGHPKGAAAAWMMNGVVQAMVRARAGTLRRLVTLTLPRPHRLELTARPQLSGTVPGNRNLDNTAPELQKFAHLTYPNRSVARRARPCPVDECN
jgi:fatty acid synthase subunit alpha